MRRRRKDEVAGQSSDDREVETEDGALDTEPEVDPEEEWMERVGRLTNGSLIPSVRTLTHEVVPQVEQLSTDDDELDVDIAALRVEVASGASALQGQMRSIFHTQEALVGKLREGAHPSEAADETRSIRTEVDRGLSEVVERIESITESASDEGGSTTHEAVESVRREFAGHLAHLRGEILREIDNVVERGWSRFISKVHAAIGAERNTPSHDVDLRQEWATAMREIDDVMVEGIARWASDGGLAAMSGAQSHNDD